MRSQCSVKVSRFLCVFVFVIAHHGTILHIDILIHFANAAPNFIGPARYFVCDILVFAIMREMQSKGFVLCELCFDLQWKFIYWRITVCARCVCEWGLRLRCVYQYLKCSVTRKRGGILTSDDVVGSVKNVLDINTSASINADTCYWRAVIVSKVQYVLIL